MKITIESTDKMVFLSGVPARIWEGISEGGVPIICFITRIAANADSDLAQFEAELKDCQGPVREWPFYDARLLL